MEQIGIINVISVAGEMLTVECTCYFKVGQFCGNRDIARTGICKSWLHTWIWHFTFQLPMNHWAQVHLLIYTSGLKTSAVTIRTTVFPSPPPPPPLSPPCQREFCLLRVYRWVNHTSYSQSNFHPLWPSVLGYCPDIVVREWHRWNSARKLSFHYSEVGSSSACCQNALYFHQRKKKNC